MTLRKPNRWIFPTALCFSPTLRWKSNGSLSKAVPVCVLKKQEPKKMWLEGHLTDTDEFLQQIFGSAQTPVWKSNFSLSNAAPVCILKKQEP